MCAQRNNMFKIKSEISWDQFLIAGLSATTKCHPYPASGYLSYMQRLQSHKRSDFSAISFTDSVAVMCSITFDDAEVGNTSPKCKATYHLISFTEY